MGLITDPSTGLLDNVDYILLAGTTGLHERFGRLYSLVNGNVDKDNLKIASDFPWAGKHTFEAGNIKVKGAGAGIASIQNANTATDRLITIPDPGADADFVTTKGSQIIEGRKTFSGADTILLPTDAPTLNRSAGLVSNVLQIHDGTSAKSYLRTDTYNESSLNGTVLLGTTNDAAYVDVAAGAKIDFSVNVPGRFFVIFSFDVYLASGMGASRSYETYFRLTTGATNKRGYRATHDEPTTTTAGFTYNMNLSDVFNFTTTGLKTVKLQKKNIAMLNLNAHSIVGDVDTNIGILMQAYRIGD